MKAIWNGQVIAEANKDELIYIEQNWYFPPENVKRDYLRKSSTPYTCPWKGVCQYFDVGTDGSDAAEPTKTESKWSTDNAWSYPEPKPSAIEQVKQDFSNYIAFWRDVSVVE